MKMAVMAVEMPSGGTSPSRRRAGTEILSPELEFRDGGGSGRFSGVSSIRVEDLGQEASYRRIVGRATVEPHNRGTRPPWAAPPPRVGPPGLPFGPTLALWKLPGKISFWALISSNSENISLLGFLKPKTAENRNWHFGISSIG